MVILLADASPLVGAVLIPIALKYNCAMAMRRTRRIVGIVILFISLALLIWGFWPLARASRIIPLPPSEMQLPTPQSLLWALRLFA
jgi:high-affinity Fe2+/Pb2+ permease